MKTGNKRFFRLSLAFIVGAALLLELTTAVLYYSAQRMLRRGMEQLVSQEMDATGESIHNQLGKTQATLDNMAWVVTDYLSTPDKLPAFLTRMAQQNPSFRGCGICFIPDYYPGKDRYYEPYAARRDNGGIVIMQLGDGGLDPTGDEYFRVPYQTGKPHWSEPYLDARGAQAMITSYGVPVFDPSGRTVAILYADLSLDWLDGLLQKDKMFDSTQRSLVTGSGHLLSGSASVQPGFLVFSTPIGGQTDWELRTAVSESEVFGPLKRVRLLMLLLVAVGLLLLTFIVLRSSQSLERLRESDEEKQRISGELQVASRIQQSMLPKNHFKQDDIEICGSLLPAREVGGDLYDYFVRDGKLFFCIGDVSGKGTPAAMLMGVTHALFRSASAHESNPARIVRAINESACQDNEANMFVTLFVGVLDLPTGLLRYCDAGHDSPFVLCKAGIWKLQCEPHLPVGVFDDVNYAVQEVQLPPDGTLFLYTDGLTEAKNGERLQFGIGNVKEVLSRCLGADQRPVRTLQLVGEAVHRFVADAPQSDDLTLLAIQYTPQRFESEIDQTLVLKNDLKELARLKEVIAPYSQELRLAVEEALVNIINYAYPDGVEGEITLQLQGDEKVLRVKISDNGAPFDPTSVQAPDLSLPAQERPIGGLGIVLVRSLVDEVNYQRIDGKNVLTLIKNK